MRQFLKNTWKNRGLVVASLPVMILLIMFSYIPMFGILVAFKDYNYQMGIFGSPWCGLENFRLLTVSKKTILANDKEYRWILAAVYCSRYCGTKSCWLSGSMTSDTKKLGSSSIAVWCFQRLLTYIAIAFYCGGFSGQGYRHAEFAL